MRREVHATESLQAGESLPLKPDRFGEENLPMPDTDIQRVPVIRRFPRGRNAGIKIPLGQVAEAVPGRNYRTADRFGRNVPQQNAVHGAVFQRDLIVPRRNVPIEIAGQRVGEFPQPDVFHRQPLADCNRRVRLRKLHEQEIRRKGDIHRRKIADGMVLRACDPVFAAHCDVD